MRNSLSGSLAVVMVLWALMSRRSLNGMVNAFLTAPSPSRWTNNNGWTRLAVASRDVATAADSATVDHKLVNLHAVTKEELEQVLTAWGYPRFRASQVYNWIREQGVTNIDDMNNIPVKLRNDLKEFSSLGALNLDSEEVSKDGTRKRAYRLWDGQLIESVLMPYADGRHTACISSQAGCAMGCVFCATGQMGFARQLTSDEIFEQVSRFASELKQQKGRLSNIVFMGMGEPMANYRNVVTAVNRISKELGIGARKITISTVGVVPNIRKLMSDPNVPQVRLAVSLHCASDEERTALLPANGRYGGLEELMTTLREYIETTGRRLTLEWALIEGQNDTPETARKLGNLIRRHGLRRDMVHINVIPLNPTGGFEGSPSGRNRVNEFIRIMEEDYGVSTTPRVRRGIDINAGCGQLKAKIEKREHLEAGDRSNPVEDKDVVRSLKSFIEEEASSSLPSPMLGVYEEDEVSHEEQNGMQHGDMMTFTVDSQTVNVDEDDFEDPEYEVDSFELEEASRLISLVQNSFPAPPSDDSSEVAVEATTTTITDEESIRKAKKRRKKLLKNIKAIGKLRDVEAGGKKLNEEQLLKIAREEEWLGELESLEHNLQ